MNTLVSVAVSAPVARTEKLPPLPSAKVNAASRALSKVIAGAEISTSPPRPLPCASAWTLLSKTLMLSLALTRIPPESPAAATELDATTRLPSSRPTRAASIVKSPPCVASIVNTPS